MRRIKCDNINTKILLNENDFLKKEVKRLKCELWQIHAETKALHEVTMPILKNRIAWCDEENKRKIGELITENQRLKDKLELKDMEISESLCSLTDRLFEKLKRYTSCADEAINFIGEEIDKVKEQLGIKI